MNNDFGAPSNHEANEDGKIFSDSGAHMLQAIIMKDPHNVEMIEKCRAITNDTTLNLVEKQ